MAKIYTLSAYETSAQEFFSSLRRHQTDLVLDVRLKNMNQLCGFTKRKDLKFLVPELTGATYVHDLRFAPEDVLLERYLHHRYSWEDYRDLYQKQMQENDRPALFKTLYGSYHSICLLGTATKKRRSHSEALAELLTTKQVKPGT